MNKHYKNLNSVKIILLAITVVFMSPKFNAQTLPNASFTFTIGTGGNVNFTSTSTNTTELICKWYFGDGISTFSVQSTSHTYSANGYYAVLLTLESSNTVLRDSTIQSLIIGGLITGMVDLKSDLEIQVKTFPNPAQHKINIFLSGNMIKSISVINNCGQEMSNCKVEIPAENYLLDTSELNTGSYFLKIETINQLTLFKQIVITTK